MYLIKMRPEQVHDTVARNVPVLMPAGVVEYHGPHLPIGTDYNIANAVCEEVQRRCECVLAPGLPLGPTMSWAAGPEDGEVDFEPEAFYQYVREMLKRIALMGYRRIYVLQHHQGDEGLQCLCLRRAAMELVREAGTAWGPGYGRQPERDWPNPRLFQRVIVAHIDSYSDYPSPESERVPIGHGGRGETQWMMAALPDTVRMAALDTLAVRPPWLHDAEEGRADEGRRWIEFCVQGWVKELTRNISL
ncbi:MAG: creatininase family protein [Chloroflexi bacterium]|nr:creatininase family protein [Chloroflexota bacterium]